MHRLAFIHVQPLAKASVTGVSIFLFLPVPHILKVLLRGLFVRHSRDLPPHLGFLAVGLSLVGYGRES